MDIRNQFTCFLIGEGTLPIQCAELLLKQGHQIKGIISSDASISRFCKDKEIPSIQPTGNLVAFLSQQPFDYLFSIVNNSVLPKEILELPRQLAINYHDALLPRYAGINATSWALMHREKTHGITWHTMSTMVDGGDILKQVSVEITSTETAFTLNGKCYEAAIHSFAQLIDELSSGRVLVSKPNLEQRTYFGRYKKPPAGGVISFNRCAEDIDALVRALDFGPYPNPLGLAKLVIGNKSLIVSKLEVLSDKPQSPPGTVTAMVATRTAEGIAPGFLKISTASYSVALREVLTSSGQKLPIPDLVARFGLQVGYQFKDIEPELGRRIEQFNALIAKHETFWVERLTTLQPLALPYAKTASHLTSKQYASVKIAVSQEVATFLEKCHPAWNQGDFLEAAFVTYLARIGETGCFDIGFRDVKLHQKLVGLESFFASYVPCRVEIESEQSFEDVFEAIRKQVELTKLHLTYVRDVVVRYPALSSLQQTDCESMFPVVVERVEHLDDYQFRSGNELTLVVSSDGKECVWFYNTEALDGESIARMQEQFTRFLQGIVTALTQPVAYLPLLSEQERHKILVEWNDTEVEYPHQCIHQLFEAQVERSPDAIAVVFEGEQLTYRELNQRANGLAHYLKTLGVGPEVLVGIYIERSLEMVVGLLGILKAGGAYVPLDPTYPSERLRYMLEDAGVPVLLTQRRLVESLPEHNARVVCLDTDDRAITFKSESNPISGVTPDNLAYVIYTSGSTGKPKGVVIEHRGAVNTIVDINQRFKVGISDRILGVSSINFDLSVYDIFGLLAVGGAIVIPEASIAPNPAHWLELMVNEKITLWNSTPPVMQLFMGYVAHQFEASLPSLRLVLLSGDWIPITLPEHIQSLGKNIQVISLGGATEASIWSIYYPIETVDSTWKSIPYGKPLSNQQFYILDSHLHPVPIGMAGEMYIGGDGVARSYLNRPDLTSEKFIPNPFSNESGSRLYKTGDQARYLSDGNIEFLGRIDNQVKIRGLRIELGEIESVLSQHPAVQETVAIVREDNPGDKRLVAYIVPDFERAFTVRPSLEVPEVPEKTSSISASNNSLSWTSPKCLISDVRHYLTQKLPAYMVPGAFVLLPSLPLTANGKVDRRALPAPSFRNDSDSIVLPRTATEEILVGIWKDVLGLEIVGVHDNFFELGGDSILSIQIISQANSVGLLLTSRQIFQHPTIAELAAIATTTEARTAEQGLVTGALPLTPIQHWFFVKNLPSPHHWNQAFLLEVPSILNPDLLQQALQQLLLHHDALRLRFNQTEGCWQQFNALPDEIVPFSLIDLSTLPENALSQTIESKSSYLQASLNLASGPLLQVALFYLGTQKPSRLLLVIHHLAVDGVSWRILLEDLQTAYKQLESGKPIQLPAKTTSFKHWAEKLTEYAQLPIATKELTYWSNISTSKITHLPTDYNRGANTEASARSVSVSLNREETRALLQEIHQAYHTQINDILLTALVQVLATWSGSNSVLIDLEGHGREEILPDVDLSRTVGWFTTIFPMLLELKATENLRDAIKFIKKQLRAIPNRGIGYGLLRYLSKDAAITSQLSSLPQAEVSFNYLGQFDWGMQSDSLVKLAPESVGSIHNQLGQRGYLLEIEGLVVEGQLQLYWRYSENFHQRETIESLAQDFAASLRTLIAHCLSADAEGYTPDVFEQTIHSLAQPINNNQHQANNVPLPLHLLELPLEISELLSPDTESAYPLAKMQEFMLHHYRNDQQKMGVYHCQQSWDIYDESLELRAFKQALEISIQKHPALRTVFIIQNGTPTVQVVKKNLSFSISEHDISHITLEEQCNYIDAVMKQDRQNLFDVENPNEPLFRFWIFQKTEKSFEFLMSIHHAIDDGWSNIEFLNQLCQLYLALKKGEEITVVPTANVYQEFVALEKEIIGSLEAANFWKLHLKDFIYKPLKPLTPSVEQVEAITEEYSFDSEVLKGLRQLCGKLGVSPKAVFLSTYLDLIATVMRENRVCVGVISNGRTERLSDPFGAFGLFWNLVPLCQSTIEDKDVQIKNVQQSLIDIEPYVRYPLLEILSDQQLDLGAEAELFFATFNFMHFHNAKNISEQTGLKVNARRLHDKFHFPLNYAVSIEALSGTVSIRVDYDPMYFSCTDICSMLQNYAEMVRTCLQTC
jgi:amino acid adenylation domain-containing protein/non-ribosomal peptide synthase protein (TIGR01720 family)